MQFDGPLFDLPGGTVKAAIGGTFTSFKLQTIVLDNTGASSLIVPYQQDAQGRQVWAVFTQVNVPIFSEQNALPVLRRVDLEFSWRHDQYSDVQRHHQSEGGVQLGADRRLHHPRHLGHLVPRTGVRRALAALQRRHRRPEPRHSSLTRLSTDHRRLLGGGTAAVGSGAWKLMSSLGPGGNGTPGSATPARPGHRPGRPQSRLPALPGISMNGGSGGSAAIRAGGGWDGSWNGLTPELATNWGIGFDYTPTGNFLTGLNIQATYYVIKMTHVLQSFGNPSSELVQRSRSRAVRLPGADRLCQQPESPGLRGLHQQSVADDLRAVPGRGPGPS